MWRVARLVDESGGRLFGNWRCLVFLVFVQNLEGKGRRQS